jgi:hypothetical protein
MAIAFPILQISLVKVYAAMSQAMPAEKATSDRNRSSSRGRAALGPKTQKTLPQPLQLWALLWAPNPRKPGCDPLQMAEPCDH